MRKRVYPSHSRHPQRQSEETVVEFQSEFDLDALSTVLAVFDYRGVLDNNFDLSCSVLSDLHGSRQTCLPELCPTYCYRWFAMITNDG